jgi:SH3-like domain-containing protein
MIRRCWKMRWSGSAIAASCLLLTVACQSSDPETSTSTDVASPNPEETTPTAPADPSTTETETARESGEAANPAPVATTPAQSCSASAFIVDTDPAGLNVRSGPGSDFAAQDTLSTSEPIKVSIVGATGAWFLINEAWSVEQQALPQPGWVYAPLLGVSTTSLNINDPEAPTTLYAEPDGSAAVVAAIPKYSEVTLLGCSGNWLQVQAPDATGWLAVGEQCSNPVSTCP